MLRGPNRLIVPLSLRSRLVTLAQYPAGPWQKLGMAVVGPFHVGPVSCRYVITLIDYHTKGPEVVFGPHVTASTFTCFLHSLIYLRWAIPMAKHQLLQ